MKKVEIGIIECQKCPYFGETGGICGDAIWCRHPSNEKSKFIGGDEIGKDFPSWCPLPNKEE